MFARTFAVVVLALPLLAAASVLPRGGGGGAPINQCNVGSLQCCNQVGQAQTLLPTAGLGGLLGVLVPITAIVGLNCNPIDVLGISGNSCSAQPVCCTGNQFNGLVNVGCSPVNLNL